MNEKDASELTAVILETLALTHRGPRLESTATFALQAVLPMSELTLLQVGVDARPTALLAIEAMITNTVLRNQVAPVKVVCAEGI